MQFVTLAHSFQLPVCRHEGSTGPLALALSRSECSRPRCIMRLARFEAVAVWAAPRSLPSVRLEGFPEWHGLEAQRHSTARKAEVLQIHPLYLKTGHVTKIAGRVCVGFEAISISLYPRLGQRSWHLHPRWHAVDPGITSSGLEVTRSPHFD